MTDWKEKTGGNAFPADNTANVNDTMGMDLRDWFAGQALAGLAAMGRGEPIDPTGTAVACYDFADTMLAARKGGQTT